MLTHHDILESYLCARQLSVLPFWKLLKCRPCTDLQTVRVDTRGCPLHELPYFPLSVLPVLPALFIHFIPVVKGFYYHLLVAEILALDGGTGTNILIWVKSSVTLWAIIHMSPDTHFVQPVRRGPRKMLTSAQNWYIGHSIIFLPHSCCDYV